ncbi:glycosyltransferase [Ligilactobacillus animalis]|uniref:glycosyltransferase n=2 Tax=Ligilactobacillus animalis TaxID=1605 RepID=UPI0026DF40A0|nr:glycosyltransferase [Ligilactobacillus animalis]MDO5883753.1 glycosyltransferase [Ligilactobacillus animalis]MDU8986431.1 glycosyltransferase [Ligilactobacillus animalis]
MKDSAKICAGIVLYNPELELLQKNVNALLGQPMEQIYLYDNNSQNAAEIAEIFKNWDNVEYIRNNENAGIAHALNQLIDYAYKDGYDWCLTMDQDSVCAPNMITEYIKYLDYPKVGLICPFVLNNGKLSLGEFKNLHLDDITEIKDPIDCITSACLNNVKVVREIGGYTEKLFIDFVDTDINCKVLENNYKIIRVNTTYLVQQMGNAHKVPFFEFLQKVTKKDVFRRMKVANVYTDQRLYYSARNSRYVRNTYKDHGKRTGVAFMFAYYCYFTLVYPMSRSRIKMWSSIIRGHRDYKKII